MLSFLSKELLGDFKACAEMFILVNLLFPFAFAEYGLRV